VRPSKCTFNSSALQTTKLRNTTANTFGIRSSSMRSRCMIEPSQSITIYISPNRKSMAKNLLIVAHSYGGHAITVLATQNGRQTSMWKNYQRWYIDKNRVICFEAFDFTHRVTAMALTDSVHSRANIKGQPVIEWFDRNVRHWVASKEELDKELPYHTNDAGCPCVSAGH
jgi:hypothetical protein